MLRYLLPVAAIALVFTVFRAVAQRCVGMFVFLGKGIVVAGLCLVGIGSLLGATISAGSRGSSAATTSDKGN